MKTLSTAFHMAIILFVVVSLSACDSGTDVGDDIDNDIVDLELSEATKSAVGGTIADVFFTIVPDGLVEGPSSKTYQVRKRFADCPGGGTTAITGSKTNNSAGITDYVVQIDLSGCSTLDGILEVVGGGIRNATVDRITVWVNGTVERGQCTVNINIGPGDDLGLDSTKNLLDNTWTQILSGWVTGTCSSEKFSCEFTRSSSLDPNTAGSSVIVGKGGCRRTDPSS